MNANTQAGHIIDLYASVEGQTVLIKEKDFAASAVATGGPNKELKDTWEMMKQLTASVTTQTSKLAALSTNKNRGGGGGGQNINKKKARPGLHVCLHFKRDLYKNEVQCLELEANQVRRYTGRKSVLTKE